MRNVTLITAVPGSGKTRYVVTRAMEAVSTGQAQESDIVCLTFSRAAASELRHRLQSFPDITVCTIHSLAGTLLESQVPRSYADVLRQATAAMPQHRYRVVFIDEAQDLTQLQLEFLIAFCTTADIVTIVGDPMQSIYQFNGSDASYMYTLAETLGGPQTSRVQLTESYRCGDVICRALDMGFHTGMHAVKSHVSDVLWYEFDTAAERVQKLQELFTCDSGFVLVRTNAEITSLLQALPTACCNARFTVNDHPYMTMLALQQNTVPVSRRDIITLLSAFGFNDYKSLRCFSALPISLCGNDIRGMLRSKLQYGARSAICTSLWSVMTLVDALPADPAAAIDLLAETFTIIGWQQVSRKALLEAASDGMVSHVVVTIDHGAPYTLMTMHAAKGLEGHTVYLLPDELNDVDEDAHLLYVAMSRASHQLGILHGPEALRCDTLLKEIIPML